MQNEELQSMGEIKLEQKRIQDCEWVFQFDEDQPQVFAWTGENITDDEPAINFSLSNVENSFISFTDKITGKRFKLFPREISEEGKQLRDFENRQMELFKNNENGSENKEA